MTYGVVAKGRGSGQSRRVRGRMRDMETQQRIGVDGTTTAGLESHRFGFLARHLLWRYWP